MTAEKTEEIAAIKKYIPTFYIYNLLHFFEAGFLFMLLCRVDFISDIQSKKMEEPQDTLAAYYDNYKETQQEIFQIECRKTRRKLLTIGLVVFILDFIGLSMLNYITINAILLIAIVPAGYILLGFLANKEPLAAIIIGAVVMLVIYGILINRFGTAVFASAIFLLRTGLFVYLFIAGFQSAREAQRIKRELKM